MSIPPKSEASRKSDTVGAEEVPSDRKKGAPVYTDDAGMPSLFSFAAAAAAAAAAQSLPPASRALGFAAVAAFYWFFRGRHKH